MKTFLNLVLLTVVAFVMVGCVAQADYDRVKTALLTEKEQNADLRARLETANSEIKALREARTGGDSDLQAKLDAALADKEAMSQKLAELEKRLRDLGATDVVLPGPIDQALRDLAASNPDLLTYDPRKGMVKIASDLTFDLGSTDVKASAASVLAKIAGVINMPEAARYEALIVGHTDNVRIARPDTRAKHPTNWHLSVHRSISVKDVLTKSSVAESRMCVAGYGEFRPVVPNGARGAQANRRVEIYLVPSTANNIEVTPAPAAEAVATPKPTAKPAAPAEAPEMFK